jgi:hypothetical protein
MDAHESRLTLAICTGVFAFTAGIFGFAIAGDQVKTRVDRRVDRRVCQLVPASCPPPAPARIPGGRGD